MAGAVEGGDATGERRIVMRLGSVFSEAIRNIGSGVARPILMFLVVLVSGGLLAGYTLAEVIGLERQAGERILTAADVKAIIGGTVDGMACDRLAETVDGPSSSGALAAGEQVTPLSTPGRSLSSYRVTSGMIALISSMTGGAKADSSGVWVSAAVAEDFGLSVGGEMATDKGTMRVAGVYEWPNDGRDTRLAYAVLIPSSPDGDGFEECWARQWPVSDQTDELLYSVVIVHGTAESSTAGITRINNIVDSQWDATAAYKARLTRYMPLVASIVGMLIGVLSVRRRRLEYSGALHSGQSKGAQLLTIAVETVVWAGLANIACVFLIAAVAARLAPSDPAAVFLAAARVPSALFAGVLLAALATGLTIRETQLFWYFKHR